jgi:hypothetical protein
MIDPKSQQELRLRIKERLEQDKYILKEISSEISILKTNVKRIHPRTTTSIALVATDGGNNKLQFDPFLVQLVRVVDSSNNEYCLDVITPTTNVIELSARQFDEKGNPTTPLGQMMRALGTKDLTKLSHMIRTNDKDQPVSPSWVQVYRELMEWAILFSIITTKDFATDTLIVFDGLLRSKIFAGDCFQRYLQILAGAIVKLKQEKKRQLYLVGVAKHSKVLERYRLAMALEGVMATEYPAYLEIPREIEQKAYVWSEYARGDDAAIENGEINKFVGGKMYFVKFGDGKRDPVWPIDIFVPQVTDAAAIMGYLYSDSVNGFPVPLYPMCLQKAHENAALVDFDFDVFQDHIMSGIRDMLGKQSEMLDIFLLQDSDPAQKRY